MRSHRICSHSKYVYKEVTKYFNQQPSEADIEAITSINHLVGWQGTRVYDWVAEQTGTTRTIKDRGP